MTRKQAVSPRASGGAGTLFEYRIAAIMLVHLLCHSHPPGLQVPVVRVGLQQRVRGHLLDDVVVYGEPGSLCTEFQVKQTLTVTAGDTEFVDVVTQALHVLADRHDDAVVRGDRALGLIAQGEARALDELATLTDWAKGHARHDTLADFFIPGVVKEKHRTRLKHVQAAVERAIKQGAPDLGGVELTAHTFLDALHVWRPSAADDGKDYRSALDQLQPVADEFEALPATVFAHLAALAENWGPFGGVVDAESVRRRLRRRGLREKSAGPSETSVAEKIDVDAVVRGPFEALHLQGALDAADALLATGDPAAVDAFAAIGARLQAKQFRPHATIMLRRRANALQAATRDDEALIARAELAWDELDRVRPWEAGFALHDGEQGGSVLTLAASTQRARSAVSAAVQVAKGGTLDRYAAVFDELMNDDPYVLRAAVFLAEEAIAADQPQLVLNRLDALQHVANGVPHSPDDLTRRHTARLQMCLADATGEWIELLREVHRRHPRPTVAWAHARYARHLALSGDGAGAQENYLEAIERACTEEMFDEAADWLYALRTVRFWYETFAGDDQHPLAQALRPHAKPSTLPGSPHTAELALHAMLDETTPLEALQQARRWRWQTVVRAQLTNELAAVRAIGTLQQRQGDIAEAIQSYVRAGNSKKAAGAARSLPEQAAHIDRRLLTAVPARRAAAYSAVAAAADLLHDDEARAWADQALDEIADDTTTMPVMEPSPLLRAFDVLASLSEALSTDQEERLLALIEPRIDRPDNLYLQTDEAIAKILLSLTSRRPSVTALLCRAVVADERMAAIILDGTDVLAAHRDAIAEHLTPFAATNHDACLAIISAGAGPTAAAVDLARSKVDRILTPQQHDPNTLTRHVGVPRATIFASVLDQDTRNHFALTMLDRALDQRDLNANRWDDLAALFNIANDLDRQTRTVMLPRVMEIARGEHDGGPNTEFDADIGLSAIALMCAARLEPDPGQCAEIEQIATAYLQAANESAQWHTVHALAALPPEHSRLDVRQCSVHPVAALRTLAAIRWANDPAALPYANASALARDTDFRVRRELARALRSTDAAMPSQTRDVLAVLATDVRRCVRALTSSQAV